MTLNVSSNSDGSITVDCGGESVTLFKPGSKDPTIIVGPKPQGATPTAWTVPTAGKGTARFPVPGGGGGAKAELDHVLADAQFVDAGTIAHTPDVVAAIHAQPQFGARKRRALHFNWDGAGGLDVGEISAALGGKLDDFDAACIVHLPDKDGP